MAVSIMSQRRLFITDFFVIILLFNKVWTDKKADVSLYDDSDPMIQLNNATIYKELERSKKHWVVEFYSNWCGHCQKFAPAWKELAWQVKNWENYLNVGAINCAAERNFDTCVAFGINSYPTIKFYGPNWKRPIEKEDEKESESFKTKEKRKLKEPDDSMGIVYKGDKKIDLIKRSLIDVIEKEQEDHIPVKSFDFASYDDIEKVTTTPASYLYLFILFESPGSYIGKNLILDTSASSSVIIRRVNYNNEMLTQQYKVTKNPSLVYIDLVKHKSELLKVEGSKYLNFVDAINSIVKVIVMGPDIDSKLKEKAEKKPIQKPQIESEVNQMDILSAISYALRREVPKNDLDREGIVALQHWVTMLTKCLPGRKPFKKFLRNLDKDLSTIPEDQYLLKKEEYTDRLNRALDHSDYKLVEGEWRSCKGSENRYRGFPCGLWTVFHTLTVNCAELDSPEISGLNVLIGIRDFIIKFFGCHYCVKHFSKMAKTIRSEVMSHNDGIIWLWKSHNRVNARLRKDESTDPVHPKIQFPPKSMCSECRSPTDNDNTFLTDPGYGVEKTSWNRRVVLEFLKDHYSPDNIRVKDKALSYSQDLDDDIESVRRKSRRFPYRVYPRKGSMTSFSFIGMSRFDMSMCVFLYVMVIGALVILYLYFLRSRRRKLYKHFV